MASALDKEERDNFFSLTLLLFRPGNKALRKYFKSRWLAKRLTTWVDCPSFGYQLFNAGGLHLDRPEIIKVQSGNTESWDMTVLIKVLRFSSLRLPTPGTTEYTDLIKLIDIRNQLICHAADARLQTSVFTPMWNDASNTLKGFAMSQQEIDDVKNDIRQPWGILFPMLQQSISQENDILEAVEKVDGQITILHQEIQETQRNILAGQQITAETVKTKVDESKCDILAGQQNTAETMITKVDDVLAGQQDIKAMFFTLLDVCKRTQEMAVTQTKEELQGKQQEFDLRDDTPHSTSVTGNTFQARPLSHDLQIDSSTKSDQTVPRTGPEAANVCGKFDSFDLHRFLYEYFRSELLLAGNLFLLIDSNPSLKEIRPPYPMAMLCEAYKRCCERIHGSDSSSLSSLYRQIVFVAAERYCQASGKPLNDTMKLIFQSLGILAFDGLVNDQCVFQETQLLSDFIDLEFIMMVDSTIRSAKTSFFFVHSSFQEFFAVHYILTCLRDDINHQVLCTINNGRIFEAMHRFDLLARITLSTQHTIEIVQSLLNRFDIQRTAVCTFVFALIGCLQGESEISLVVCATAKYFPEQIDIDCSIHLALSGFSSYLVPRVVPSNVFEHEQTNGADGRPSKAPDIKELLFHQLPSEEGMLTKLSDALSQLKALKCLRFGTGCNISETSVLLRALKPPCLTELSITQYSIASVADVQSFIKCVFFESLTKLTLTNIMLGVNGAIYIHYMLKRKNNLRSLTVSGCELGPIGCGLLLEHSTSLETLDIT